MKSQAMPLLKNEPFTRQNVQRPCQKVAKAPLALQIFPKCCFSGEMRILFSARGHGAEGRCVPAAMLFGNIRRVAAPLAAT